MQLFCPFSIPVIISYDAIFCNSLVLFARLQVVNDLLSSLFSWFRLVLHNTYCLIIAENNNDTLLIIIKSSTT